MKPLEGLRVVDFGIITAGASTSAMLADLGADVIKVEGPAYIDPFRKWAGAADDEEWWNASPHFHFTNRNKKSICVDLKSERGRELLLELVAISDIVIENFRVGVLDRLGLGFEELKKVNPRLVLGSISSQGITGPDADAVSFGSTLEASSGLSDLIRYGDDEAPHITGQALNYPDQVVSLIASGLIISTVLESRRTKRSYHIDVSQREVTAFLLGEKLVEAAYGVKSVPGSGAPHILEGVYACGDGQWLALTIKTTEAASVLSNRLGIDGLDDGRLESWLAEQTANEALEQLCAPGVCATLARRIADLPVIDEIQNTSTAFSKAPDGKPVKGLPWKTDEEDLIVRHTAPGLGQHNHSVVVGLLNRSEENYRELVVDGVLAQAPA